jgi:hypothetical protein
VPNSKDGKYNMYAPWRQKLNEAQRTFIRSEIAKGTPQRSIASMVDCTLGQVENIAMQIRHERGQHGTSRPQARPLCCVAGCNEDPAPGRRSCTAHAEAIPNVDITSGLKLPTKAQLMGRK